MTSSKSIAAVLSTALLVPLVASCSVEQATEPPWCEGGDSMIIAAQSVPSAEMLPCFTPLPLGWEVDAVDVTHDGTTVRFDSDRGGHHAAELVFDEVCDLTGTAQQTNDQDGVERFDRTERLEPGLRASVFHVFEGGCTTWRFDFNAHVPRSELTVLEETLTLVPRSVVRDGIAESFIDREL